MFTSVPGLTSWAPPATNGTWMARACLPRGTSRARDPTGLDAAACGPALVLRAPRVICWPAAMPDARVRPESCDVEFSAPAVTSAGFTLLVEIRLPATSWSPEVPAARFCLATTTVTPPELAELLLLWVVKQNRSEEHTS